MICLLGINELLKMIWCKILLLALIGGASACHLFPPENNVGSLVIEIIGNPFHFVPSSLYSVEVKSSKEFEGLLITSEGGGVLQVASGGGSTFSEDCLNTIQQLPGRKGRSLTVFWAAPGAGCPNLKAAAKIDGQWITVNKTICSIDEKINSVSKCCACDHAKYKLTFEGLWSPKTHPKDFPNILWMTHFSDVIGATHSSDFSIWEEGKLSTYGVQQMAEYGIVRELENELRNQSKMLKTIVHAAGLWYPDVNSKTSTVFKVDPRKHLLSLASMFGPSPDWFVGLSNYDLCLPNCSWIENVVMELYPYDAGTDGGISYMSPNVPADPPERIQKITTMYPEDARSPFYDPVNHEMKPFALLTLTREAQYKKKCSDLTEEEILQEVQETENTEDESRAECQVSAYSDWTSCSVSCGKGIRQRSRQYLNPDGAKMSKCDRQLVSKEMCAAPLQKCPGESEEEDVTPLGFDSTCEVTPWTDWSDCTVTCGIGMKFRSRELVASENSTMKKCMHISRMEKQKCMEPPCYSQEQKVPRACSVSEWSEWTPCSVSCGEGYRKRTRFFQTQRVPKFCYAAVNITQTLKCRHPKKCEVGVDEAQGICLLDIFTGPCRGAFRKWAFDRTTGNCREFYYGGCRGNRNNFETFEACKNTCGSVLVKGEGGSETTGEIIDCVVGKWGSWSPCYPCENGTKIKTRPILRAPQNGGRLCPSLQKTANCRVPAEFCDSV